MVVSLGDGDDAVTSTQREGMAGTLGVTCGYTVDLVRGPVEEENVLRAHTSARGQQEGSLAGLNARFGAAAVVWLRS